MTNTSIVTTPTQKNNKTASCSSQVRTTEKIVLPMPPAIADLASGQDTRFEMEIYARFMAHLRNVPNSRMEIKVLASIRFTSDMLEISEALVAKTLVDLGLRAPRKAFPGTFLDFCDRCALRQSWNTDEEGKTPDAVLLLKDHWDRTGEDRFGPLPVQYAIFNSGVLVSR